MCCSLKLQSVSFASLSLSMFENLELQLFVQLCSLRGLCSGADESNVLRRMCGSQSRTGVDTVLRNH